MIDLNKCEGYQKRDSSGMVMPWYTWPALEEIEKWDLSEKKILEFGGGSSTLWFAKRCREIVCVETDQDYSDAIISNRIHNLKLYGRLLKIEGLRESGYFNVDLIYMHKVLFEIIVVDCDPVVARDFVIGESINVLKPGGKLIVDNWRQPSVYMPSNSIMQALVKFEVDLYRQPDHEDWQTAIFTKPL